MPETPSTNGHARRRELSPRALRQKRSLLREQRLVLEDQARLAQVLHLRHLMESSFALGDSDGYWSGSDALDRSLWGPSFLGSPFIPPTTPSDRRHGQNWPVWRTEVDLAILRQRSRVQLATNHFAASVVNNVVNYVIGTGCSYNVISKELTPTAAPQASGDSDDKTTALCAVFQDWLDRWLARNRWNDVADLQGDGVIAESRERESCRRVIRDGELLYWLWCYDDGSSDVRWIEPEQLQQPPAGEGYPEGWSFGKKHKMQPLEDVETIEAYHVVHQDASTADGYAEVIDAAFVVHVLVPGTDSTLARGMPMLSFGTADAFDRALKLERNASIGAAIRAATAEIWTHEFGTQTQIQTMADQLAARQAQDSTGKTVDYERLGPGAIRRLPKGITPVTPAPDQSNSFLAAVQADLRAAGSPFSAPEYWTGATDNGNYSNLETASAPTVQMGKSWQKHFKAAFLRVLWKAVRWAVECGQLPREVLRLCDIQCEAPTVLHRNELEITQQRQIECQNGVLSRQTWCQERGLDWETEAANIQEWNDEFGQQGMPLQLPGGPEGEKPPVPGPARGDVAPAGLQ